jgi:DNA primase
MVTIMPSPRLDFKDLRARASIATVLDAYGIELTKDGHRPGQFKALCPFHEDKNPSLKVSTDKNVYHCFVCEAKGNVIDFVMAKDGLELRPAALKVATLCGLTGASPLPRSRTTKAKQSQVETASVDSAEVQATSASEAEPAEPNKPLGFTMKLEHPPELMAWLQSRGLATDTIETFGLGLASTKSKSIGGRLAIPLHNATGELVGYCGRYLGDSIPDEQPKYILPKGFRKEIELFNLHRIRALSPAPRFVVMFESYFSVMRHAVHVPAVSPMGRTVSETQVELLKATGIETVLIVFDGDEPGQAGARDTAALLSPHFWVRVVNLPDGKKPHRLPWEDLRPILRAAWRKGAEAP